MNNQNNVRANGATGCLRTALYQNYLADDLPCSSRAGGAICQFTCPADGPTAATCLPLLPPGGVSLDGQAEDEVCVTRKTS